MSTQHTQIFFNHGEDLQFALPTRASYVLVDSFKAVLVDPITGKTTLYVRVGS